MRRDAKLGLALGMLVVGFAVAFCFPRRPPEPWSRPDLADLVADSELDFLPVRAYQAPVSEPSQSSTETPAQDAPLVASASSRLAEDPPAPIAPVVRAVALTDILNMDKRTADSQPAPSPSDSQSATTVENDGIEQTHRVQPGETLTGIALRYLGSSRRYLEIYEANKDRMSGPDNLQVGLELRIPRRTKPGQPLEPVRDEDQWSQEEEDDIDVAENEENSDDSAKLFRRAGRAPFLSERPVDLPLNSLGQSHPKVHVIKPGETLEEIAIRYYGRRSGIEHLQAANPDTAADPRRLRAGTKLLIEIFPAGEPLSDSGQ